uniref:Piwi domain-containing protein n=1 Tax=Heliothis virescens TaxID=7102 RepID=A0A2A4JWD3_HELVI
MVKPSKKKGKKDAPKDQTPSSEPVEEPSTSELPPAEGEDDSNLSAAERKRRERKEKKEKARQTMEASRKPSTRLDSTSETTSGSISRAASEAPSEPSVEAQLPAKTKTDAPPEAPAAAAPAVTPAAVVKAEPEAEEEESGLGLTSSKKKKPRKKKGDASRSAEGQQPSAAATAPAASAAPAPAAPAAVATSAPAAPAAPAASATSAPTSVPTDQRSLSGSSSSSLLVSPGAAPGPTPVLVQMPEPAKPAQPGAWGRGRGWGPGPGPSTAMPPPRASPMPPTAAPMPPTAAPKPTAQPVAQQLPMPTRPPKSLEPVLCRYKIPTKIPGGIVRARAIRVMVNYLEMKFKPLQISRYDVSFSPDRPKRMLPEVFQIVKSEYFANELIAFDQMKNCYSLRPLKNVTSTERFHTRVEILDQNQRPMTFEVSMKATGVVDLGNIQRYMANKSSSLCHPTEEIQCIDVILRQGALESYVKAGRQFFKRPMRPVDLGYGYEMWTGLFQSAIFTNKSFINIDVAHKGFPKCQSLLDALVKDFSLDPTRPVDNQRGAEHFIAFVKGLKVVATMVGNVATAGHRREYICNGLVGPPDELTFTITDPDGRSRKTTVGEYFAREKKYRLKYPKLNCLWVGSRDKCIYFPIELLQVAYGQPLARQLNEMQVSKMVKEAATPPDERLQKITEVISNMKYSQNRDFKQFGLEICDKFYTVKAKVLEPPTLEIGNGKTVPRKGQWQANRLLKPEHLQSWGLIALDTDPRNDYDNMISLIISTGNQMGMSVAKPKLVMVSAKMTSLQSILLNAYRDVKFLFIIVSARGRDDYHKVKQMAEREVGILTQCVKEMTARRMNPMTARNILLKVNSKLMGINQAIDSVTMPKCLKDGGVMIVGADVTHPSPEQSNIPSIAAVTASIDPKCYMYNIELSIQTPKKEMIVEFEDMMFDHLRVYKERNHNNLPRKIFVFRDGVSEGQFAQVMNSELAAVHNAYQRMAGQTRKPEVLFLLVQKRHHTRDDT